MLRPYSMGGGWRVLRPYSMGGSGGGWRMLRPYGAVVIFVKRAGFWYATSPSL
ncbi:MAG: hypothetical protein OHK0046_49660 [Anaerolineae bacterium]